MRQPQAASDEQIHNYSKYTDQLSPDPADYLDGVV